MVARVAAAAKHDARVLVSSVTLVEARNPATAQARFDRAVPRLTIEPVSEPIARHASGTGMPSTRSYARRRSANPGP